MADEYSRTIECASCKKQTPRYLTTCQECGSPLGKATMIEQTVVAESKPIPWKKILIVGFLVIIVAGLILEGCDEKNVRQGVFDELTNYVDVVSVTINEDATLPYPSNPQSPEHQVKFEAQLKDGTTISGMCDYNAVNGSFDPNNGVLHGFKTMHIDGDGDYEIGNSGSKYQLKTQDANK